MPIINASAGGREKINGAQTVRVVAQDEISIGDVVYTVEQRATKTVIPAQEWSYDANMSGTAVFSSDGSILVVFGLIHGTHIYAVVNDTTLTFVDYLRNENGDECSNYTFGEFSPDGTLFVASTDSAAYIYTVSGTSLQFKRRINDTSNEPTYVHFSPDGTKMIMPHSTSSNSFDIYSTGESDVQYVGTYGDLVATESDVLAGAFSPDGTLFVNGANRSDSLFQVYSMSTLGLIQSVSSPNGNNSQAIINMKFSPDGTILVVGTASHTYVFTVSEDGIFYEQELFADGSAVPLWGGKGCIDFSYDGSYFYATFADEGAGYVYVKTFYKSGTTLTYSSNTVSYSLSSREVYELYVTCSPTSNIVIITGGIPTEGYMQGYQSYGSSLYLISGYTPKLSSTLHRRQYEVGAFSPNGSILILDGNMGYQIYSVNGADLTFIGNLAGTQANWLYGNLTFSPDGTLLFAGNVDQGMNIYEVSGTTFTLISTLLDTQAVFITDDGSKMIGVQYSDTDITTLKYYSIVERVVTEISEVTMNGRAWDNLVYDIAFTTDGNYAVFVGWFTDRASVYKLETNSVNYFATIYADNDGSLFEYGMPTVARFPDKNEFLIGGTHHISLENGQPTILSKGGSFLVQAKVSPNGRYVEYGTIGGGGLFIPVYDNKLSYDEQFILTDTNAAHIFAPDCSIVIGSGTKLEDRLVVYTTFDDGLLMARKTYLMRDNTFGNGIATSAKIGFSKNNMAVGDTGKVRHIHDVKLAPVWG